MELPVANRNKLLISADDFGMNNLANQAIFFLINIGKIDRVAVMANGTISPQEAETLIHSGVKIDIHLDIERTDYAKAKKHGALRRLLHFGCKYVFGSFRLKKIYRDWDTQIQKFHEIFGKYPDGINSHEHVHMFGPFFKVARNLQDAYSIPYIRFGREDLLERKNFVAFILKMLHKHLCHHLKKHNPFATSDYLTSLDWIDDFDTFLENLPPGTIEIVCHPERSEEFDMLKNRL